MLLWRAEAHHLLHSGLVIPGPVEHRDFSGRWQVRDIALEVPLGHFSIVGFRQRELRIGLRRASRQLRFEVLFVVLLANRFVVG